MSPQESLLSSNETEVLCPGCGPIPTNSSTVVYGIPILIISLLSLPGNLLILVVIWTTRSMHTNQGRYMFSLGCSEIGSAVISILFSARYALSGEGPASLLELEIGAGLSYLFLTNTMITVIVTGLDKLAQIECPYNYERILTRRRCLRFIAGLWIVISFLSVLPTRLFPIANYFYHFNQQIFTFVTVHQVQGDGVNALFVVRLIFMLSMILLLTGGYGRLYLIARRHMRKERLHNAALRHGPDDSSIAAREGSVKDAGNGRRRARAPRPQLRGALTIALVLGTFILFWLPLFALHMALAKGASRVRAWSRAIDFGLIWLARSQGAVYVFIYCGTYRCFRAGMRRFCHDRLRCPAAGRLQRPRSVEECKRYSSTLVRNSERNSMALKDTLCSVEAV